MSESQVPAQETVQPEPSTVTTVKIGEEEYPVEEVASWKEAAAERKRMQADYTKKTQKLAEDRRALEAKEASLKGLAETPGAARAATTGNFSALDEYVPGLGNALASVVGDLQEIKQAQAKLQSENSAAMQAVEVEEAWDKALKGFQGKGYANPEEMRKFCEDRNLGPDSLDLAHDSLYAFKLGQQAHEEALKRRNAGAKPPMKGGNLGIPGSVPQEVPAAPAKSVSKTSWQEFRNLAKADPRKPVA